MEARPNQQREKALYLVAQRLGSRLIAVELRIPRGTIDTWIRKAGGVAAIRSRYKRNRGRKGGRS